MIIDPMRETGDDFTMMQMDLLALAVAALASGQRWVASFALALYDDIETYRAESLGCEEELEELRGYVSGAIT